VFLAPENIGRAGCGYQAHGRPKRFAQCLSVWQWSTGFNPQRSSDPRRSRTQKAIDQKLRKGEARKAVEAFIQNVHHFRDAYLADDQPPVDHVVIFDEAQRAWTLEQTTQFMARKKGVLTSTVLNQIF